MWSATAGKPATQTGRNILAKEFKERRGYDIIKYLPVLVGETIDSEVKSERFKNDFKLTISDLISEHHYEHQRDVAHEHDLHSYAEAAGPHQFQADLMKCVGPLRCGHGRILDAIAS
jgi:hypothetical protein